MKWQLRGGGATFLSSPPQTFPEERLLSLTQDPQSSVISPAEGRTCRVFYNLCDRLDHETNNTRDKEKEHARRTTQRSGGQSFEV